MALLTAIALTIFLVEAQLPALAPIPGMKLGLANIVTVYAMWALGPGDTLIILLCRVFLGSVFSGQMMTLIYSLSGGLLCYLSMLALRPVLGPRSLWLSSVVGAMCHNIGQLAAAMAVMKTAVVWAYLPALLASGVVTGAFTGLAAQAALHRLSPIASRRNQA